MINTDHSGLFSFLDPDEMTATLLAPPRTQSAAPANGTSAPKVVPMLGEAQGQFFDRANRALQKSIPQQNRRTVEILRLWQASDNDAEIRQEARDRFPSQKFTYYGPRCIFLSHTIPAIAEQCDERGEVIQEGREGTIYNRENIQKLVDFANYRIRNAGQFAALSNGHMPTLEEKERGRPDAETLGWAGPFYIGLFGNVNPQWAVFCDEWIHNEDVAKAEKLQRRSPEVWFKEPIEKRTMDPIAMLGSETPRLDSGMNLYAKRACDGQHVVHCYSMSMALPNAVNSYVPGNESGKQRYGANDMDGQGAPPPAQGQPGASPDALIDVVINAITDLMPTIIQKCQDALRAGDDTDPDAVPQGGADDGDAGGADDANPDESGADGNGDEVPRGMDQPDEPQPDASGQVPTTGDAQMPDAGLQSQPSDTGMTAPPEATPQAAQPPFGGDPSTQSATTQPDLSGGMQGGVPGAATGGGAPGLPPAPEQPIDNEHAQYAAMSPECGQAYAAGHAAGSQKGRPMTTNYSKATSDMEARFAAQEKRIAAQAKRIEDLELAARDAERYGKIHAIAQEHDIGDEREVLAEIINAPDEEFERYSKVLRKAPKRGDVTDVDLYDDSRMDVETENYSRNQVRRGVKQPSQDEIQRYSRQAADSVVKKRGRGVETTLDAEMKLIFEAAGYPDPTV